MESVQEAAIVGGTMVVAVEDVVVEACLLKSPAKIVVSDRS